MYILLEEPGSKGGRWVGGVAGHGFAPCTQGLGPKGLTHNKD